jgi:hypothetical protein
MSLRVLVVLGAVLVLVAGSTIAYAALGSRSDKAEPQAAASHAPKVTVSKQPVAPAVPATSFAPYVDVQYDPPVDLTRTMKASGAKQYILGFIIAGGGCNPMWGGDQSMNEDEIVDRVKNLRKAGGDFRLSFGGAAGTELASACGSATALAAAYQKAIDAYSATMIDFDVEGDKLSDTAADDLRAQAIAILERNATAAKRKLNVSLTLPTDPSGLTGSPRRMLTAAVNYHARIDIVNIMAMDYGHWAAPDPEANMGNYAIQAMKAVHVTIGNFFHLTDAEAWRRVGVTPLIGVNSPATEVFSLEDAAKVGAFAREHKVGMFSMWAITRDRPCPSGVKADAETDACAGNAPSNFAFSKAFLGPKSD